MPAYPRREPGAGDAELEPRGRVPVFVYEKGSRGPAAGDALMRDLGLVRSEGYEWRGKQ
jgi:hypothetical protein